MVRHEKEDTNPVNIHFNLYLISKEGYSILISSIVSKIKTEKSLVNVTLEELKIKINGVLTDKYHKNHH